MKVGAYKSLIFPFKNEPLSGRNARVFVVYSYNIYINTAQQEFYRRNITIRNIGLTEKKKYKFKIIYTK